MVLYIIGGIAISIVIKLANEVFKYIKKRFDKYRGYKILKEMYPRFYYVTDPAVFSKKPVKILIPNPCCSRSGDSMIFISDYCFLVQKQWYYEIKKGITKKTGDEYYYIFFPESKLPYYQRLPKGKIKEVNEEFLREHFGNGYIIQDHDEYLKRQLELLYNLFINKALE